MAAVFGWQGFSFEHPDDWAPVALTGDRASGYARLASPRALSLQIRWEALERDDLEAVLDKYLDRLSRDARKKRLPFSRTVDGRRYRYKGEVDGEGTIFATNDRRIAFLEAVGESSTARRRALDLAQRSFEAEGFERWSVLGLDFRLPGPLRLEKKEFLAGRTSLVLARRGVQVTAERWGLAESLLARMPLAEWAQGRLGRGWTLTEDEPGLRASRGSVARRAVAATSVVAPESLEQPRRLRLQRFALPFDEALVLHQPERNQIVLLRVRARDAAWRPQWDWLT